MSQGKGISDAVRGAVREWMTDDTVNFLYEQHKGAEKDAASYPSFARMIRQASEWVRISRSRGLKGWTRVYYSKLFNDRSITLHVNSNEQDTLIEYVTIRVRGKVIGGGTVNVPSVLVSQRGRKAGLQLDGVFVAFTADQVKKLQAEMEFGEAAVMDLLFEERIV